MLYRDATLRWLAGGDPWALRAGDAVFGAPPPTLLAMLPFAILPDVVARIALVGLGIVASVWVIRRLRLPLWWLAFPPLVDGLYIANPHVFVVPLLVAGAGPAAIFVKVYAGAVPALQLRWRPLLITVSLVLITAPFLPWALFVERWPQVSAALASQSGRRRPVVSRDAAPRPDRDRRPPSSSGANVLPGGRCRSSGPTPSGITPRWCSRSRRRWPRSRSRRPSRVPRPWRSFWRPSRRSGGVAPSRPATGSRDPRARERR